MEEKKKKEKKRSDQISNVSLVRFLQVPHSCPVLSERPGEAGVFFRKGDWGGGELSIKFPSILVSPAGGGRAQTWPESSAISPSEAWDRCVNDTLATALIFFFFLVRACARTVLQLQRLNKLNTV